MLANKVALKHYFRLDSIYFIQLFFRWKKNPDFYLVIQTVTFKCVMNSRILLRNVVMLQLSI